MWIKIDNKLINLGELTSVTIEENKLTIGSKSHGMFSFGIGADATHTIDAEKLEALKVKLLNSLNVTEIS